MRPPNASRYVASHYRSHPAASNRSNCLLPILIFWIAIFTLLLLFGLSDSRSRSTPLGRRAAVPAHPESLSPVGLAPSSLNQ